MDWKHLSSKNLKEIEHFDVSLPRARDNIFCERPLIGLELVSLFPRLMNLGQKDVVSSLHDTVNYVVDIKNNQSKLQNTNPKKLKFLIFFTCSSCLDRDFFTGL